MGAASSSASTSATQINLFAALWIVQRRSAAGLGGSGGGLVVRRGMAGVSAPRVGRGKRRGATQGRGRYSPWNVRSLPVRSHHRAELAALATPHTRAERQHQHVIGPGVDVDLRLVDAVLAGHEESTYTILAHVAEGHGTRRRIIPSHSSS